MTVSCGTFGELKQQIDSMLGSLRRIVTNLRPVLDDLGLGAFMQRFHVTATLRTDIDDTGVSPFASASLYRIVQEALPNVARPESQAKW
jgi:signal transduction histidine kinase